MKKFLVLLILLSVPCYSQNVTPFSLVYDSNPPSNTVIPIWEVGLTRAKKTTLADILAGVVKISGPASVTTVTATGLISTSSTITAIGAISTSSTVSATGVISSQASVLAPEIDGSTLSGGSLTLKSTTNGTKGSIKFGTSAYDEVNQKLGIGTITPTSQITSSVSSNITNEIRVENTNAGTTAASVLSSRADVASLLLNTYSSVNSATLFGLSVQSMAWVGQTSGNGLIIGLNNNKPMYFGTNGALSYKIDAGTQHIVSLGPIPTVACTGTGTAPAAPSVDTGSDDKYFEINMPTGTGAPGSTGTCTVTFAGGYSTRFPTIVCMLVKGGTAWGNGATIQLTTESLTAPIFTWNNLVGGVATALTVSTSYKFSCVTFGK